MKKGNYGISLTAIAIIAFVFVLLRQPQSVLLVAGFALLAERDPWLNRQVIQALLLTMAYYGGLLVLEVVFGGLSDFLGWVDAYRAQANLVRVVSVLQDLLFIGLLVLVIMALLKVMKGQDANVPFLGSLIQGDVPGGRQRAPEGQGSVTPRNAPEKPYEPVKQTPPPPPRAPEPVQEVAPPLTAVPVVEGPKEPEVKRCPACHSPVQEGLKFCTECGEKIL